MWHVKNSETWKKAQVKLDSKQFDRGFPSGKEGVIIKGFAFYQIDDKEGGVVVENEIKKITMAKLNFVTAQIGEKPILTAVTEAQQKLWQKLFIIAIPAKFHWKKKGG